MHVYEVRPRTDHRDVDLISDAVGCGTPNRMREGQPPRKNDRPKRCPSPWVGSVSDRPRLGSSAICVDRPASPLCEILLSKLVTFQSPFDSDDTTADPMTPWFAFTTRLATWSRRTSIRAISKCGEVSIVAVVAGATVDRENPMPVTIIMVVVVIPIVVAVIAVSVVTPMIVIGRRPSR